MLFETSKKAENFIKFNRDEIEAESGYGPQRSYHCMFCEGWHVTSIKENIGLSRKERIFEQFRQEEKEEKRIKVENNEERNKKMKDLEGQIKEMEHFQKEKFFSDTIDILKNEIELRKNSESTGNKKRLKELRQDLEIHYYVRKESGIQTVNKTKMQSQMSIENEIEEWRLWAEKKGYQVG